MNGINEKAITSYGSLKNKIENKDAKICVVGMGYVGLPLAIAFAKTGYFVYGFDTSVSRIKKLKKGERYIVDIDPGEVLSLVKKNKFCPSADEIVLGDSDVIIICVPTPLRKVKLPDISYIVDSAKAVKKYLKPRRLIILESTSYTTTTREVVLPILKESGLKEEKDFFLCFSPERVNPGDKKFPIIKIPKLVGGLSEQSTELARILYSKIMKKVFPVSSPEVAETSKLLENTFRMVNIALINEFAIVCNKMGISIWEVIEAAKTKPFGFMPFYPGPGIGGHCIPCDPLYLSWKAKKLGFKTKMIDLAAYTNRYMPKYVVERVLGIFKQRSISAADAKVLVLGAAYKKDVKDLRESPALDIIEDLLTRKIKVEYSDPLIPYLKIGNINMNSITLTKNNIGKYDCVILVTDHSGVDYEFIRINSQLIFDTRNAYKKVFSNIVKL